MRFKRKKLLFVVVLLISILLYVYSANFSRKFTKNEECSTVHIAVVSVGQDSSRRLIVLCKSLLFHRTKPLHLHLIVDDVSEHILANIFKTWNLPDFSVSFYMDSSYISEVSWIKNTHYSGVYGLLKLMIPDILPVSVKKAVVFDVDMIMNDDINSLLMYFEMFNKDQAIGLVENQSNWYLKSSWPAVGHGYNSGVILIDLVKVRSLKWKTLWVGITEKLLQTHYETQLADQDIINALIFEHPNIVYTLPCVYNYQLNQNVVGRFCPLKELDLHHKVKVYHWNTPYKQESKNSNQHGSIDLYNFFSEMNGEILKQELTACNKHEVFVNPSTSTYVLEENNNDYEDDYNIEKVCEELIQKPKLHRIHLYFLPYTSDTKPKNTPDFTLVVQFSIDRLSSFEKLCENWAGPISAAIFATDHETSTLENFYKSSDILNKRTNIGYHVVFKTSHNDVYPINLLRNIALQQASTEFVFLLDVDFVPDPSLYSYLQSFFSNNPDTGKKAYVVPAFENLYYNLGFPQNKSQLIDLVKEGKVTTFHSYIWQEGHRATDFERWYKTDLPYKVRWQRNFEPYLVLRKNLCPLYDKRFAGFGWNKVTHVMELDAMGFEFEVLPLNFVVHQPHQPSSYLERYRKEEHHRDCIQWYKIQFVSYLVETYNVGDPNKYNDFAADSLFF